MKFSMIKRKYFANPSWMCGVVCGLAILALPFGIGEKVGNGVASVRDAVGNMIPKRG